jgi:dTDP-4-amino-4,6-dideoxygalactose transaminase
VTDACHGDILAADEPHSPTAAGEQLRVISTDAPPIPFHVPDRLDVDGFVEDARVILESGRLSLGPYTERLERGVAPWVGDGTVTAVSNCSDGLIAALWAIRDAGAEVVVPGFTYLATWQAVVWAGMTPVVADVDERGLLDPAAAEAAIGPRTRLILGVHLSGHPADVTGLRAVADRHGLALLFDSAHALGARWADRPVGAGGDIEVFSIGPTKQLGVSEGGLVVANDPELAARVRRFSTQGHRLGELDALGMGMNLRMPELTAAMALRALPMLDGRLKARAVIADRYRTTWRDLPMRLPGPQMGERSAFKDLITFVDEPTDREPVRDHLASAGIATKPYYDPAIPDLTAFEGRIASADQSRELARKSFALPIHGRLTEPDVDRILAAVCSYPAWS